MMSSTGKTGKHTTLYLRLAALAVAALFVPAFVYGAVSLWSVVLSFVVALRFRDGLIVLNRQLDEAGDVKQLRPRLRFWGLVGECVLYSYLAFGTFLFTFGGEFLNWRSHAVGLDQTIGFPRSLYFVGPRPDVDFYSDIADFSMGVSATLFSCVVVACFAFLSKLIFEVLKKGKVVFNLSDLDGFAGVPALGTYTIFGLILGVPLLLFGLFYSDASFRSLFDHLFIFVVPLSLSLLYPYVLSIVLITQFHFCFFKKDN